MKESKLVQKIAFIGLGVMGYPMAGHCKKSGHEVTVFNRTTNKAQAWVNEFSGMSSHQTWQDYAPLQNRPPSGSSATRPRSLRIARAGLSGSLSQSQQATASRAFHLGFGLTENSGEVAGPLYSEPPPGRNKWGVVKRRGGAKMGDQRNSVQRDIKVAQLCK